MFDDSPYEQAYGVLRYYFFLWTIERLHLHSPFRHAEVSALEKIIRHLQHKKNP